MFCWRDWPNSLGSANRASVGPWPPTSELSDRHPCSTTPAEPPAARESHSGRRRMLRSPTLRTWGRQPAVAVLVETRVRRGRRTGSQAHRQLTRRWPSPAINRVTPTASFVVLQLVDRASSALALGVAQVNAVLGRRLRIGRAWASERCGIEDTLSCASSAVDRPERRVRFLGGTR